MKPTLPLQLQGVMSGLPPAASSVSSPQHSRQRGAPELSSDTADVVRSMAAAAVLLIVCCCSRRAATAAATALEKHWWAL